MCIKIYNGYDDKTIFFIFDHYAIGEKYRENGSSKQRWLKGQIEKARQFVKDNHSAQPEHYPLFLTLARTGMRLGEALGLQWGDLDFHGNFIEIRRALVEGRLTTTKTGKTRRVDGSPQLMATLKSLKLRRKEQALRQGWGKVPEWIFINQDGKPIDQGNLRGRVHYKACENAKLRRIRIHDIRHSYATIRIAAGHNIADVSRQLGHASIKITVDTYYHWLPNQNSSEVSELDDLGKERNHPQPIRNQNKKGIPTIAVTP